MVFCPYMKYPQSLLTHVDALIYLDTDTLILGNLSKLWDEFSHMGNQGMLGMAPDIPTTYNVDRGIPYVGPIGILSPQKPS